jgi:hypothetical protein
MSDQLGTSKLGSLSDILWSPGLYISMTDTALEATSNHSLAGHEYTYLFRNEETGSSVLQLLNTLIHRNVVQHHGYYA